jgi:hypothetical protein
LTSEAHSPSLPTPAPPRRGPHILRTCPPHRATAVVDVCRRTGRGEAPEVDDAWELWVCRERSVAKTTGRRSPSGGQAASRRTTLCSSSLRPEIELRRSSRLLAPCLLPNKFLELTSSQAPNIHSTSLSFVAPRRRACLHHFLHPPAAIANPPVSSYALSLSTWFWILGV